MIKYVHLNFLTSFFIFQMFEATLRLATAYVDLCEAGNSRYIGWNEEIRCCFDKNSDKFNALVHKVEEMCRTMESHLIEWKKKLHHERWIYPNLNFFTVQQILYLQHALAGICKNPLQSQVPAQVYTLLESIYPSVSREVLKNAVYSVSHEMQPGLPVRAEERLRQTDYPKHRLDTVSVVDIESLLPLLENEGLPDDGAMAALNASGAMAVLDASVAERVDMAVMWYYENQYHDKLLKTLSDEMKEILVKKRETIRYVQVVPEK